MSSESIVDDSTKIISFNQLHNVNLANQEMIRKLIVLHPQKRIYIA
jgi:hypothetical protein